MSRPQEQRVEVDVKDSLKAVLPGVGGVAAAVGSALCYAGPVLAVTLGVSGAGLSRFEPFRPYFLGATAVFLVLGFWLLDREEKAACEVGRPRPVPKLRRRFSAVFPGG